MAVARAALEQKMYDLDHPQARTPAVAAPVTTASTPKASMATAPATGAPVVVVKVAPVTSTPVVVHAAVAPVMAVPKAVAPVVSSRPVVAAPIKKLSPVTLALHKTSLVLHAAPLPSRPLAQVKTAPALVTITGSVYRNAEVQRVMPDGIIISYTPAGGGWAMTKVNFEDLSPELQQRYLKH
jgi:hypothetical protein